jgi:CRP-like cAMP-binding protein
MSDLLATLEALTPISPALRAALAAAVRREELPTRYQLLVPGQVAQRLYFVEHGLVRGYALHGGREVSSWFMHEGDFVISIVSFFTQQPSTEYLELLEASILHSIGHTELQALYREFPEFNAVGRVLTERYYVQSERRAYQLRAHPAVERYAQLLREFPAVFQRVALKHIASHLGVAAETLSRLRARPAAE